ncbi:MULTISPECIES: DUF305 domain-containing protein [unclassified Nonomuraea]|uniref:DUF305 domain-containing protein n=1 Tax=unclassified Nonomuraea TaxID=2593643 RepID=UPI0034069FDF
MSTNRKIGLAAAAGALVLLTACGANDTASTATTAGASATESATASAPSSQRSFNDADVMFAQMMIPHHQQAVEMADLAPQRAKDPEIKKLAADIKAAQDPEIQTMKGWLTEWGKPVPSGGMGHDMPGIMSAEDMKKLEGAKGAAFDRLFAEQMIAHHEGAIEMARTEQASGVNPQAKELAKAIESTQQAEVAQLRKLLERL